MLFWSPFIAEEGKYKKSLCIKKKICLVHFSKVILKIEAQKNLEIMPIVFLMHSTGCFLFFKLAFLTLMENLLIIVLFYAIFMFVLYLYNIFVCICMVWEAIGHFMRPISCKASNTCVLQLYAKSYYAVETVQRK